jgi:acyl carrier protein
MNASVLERVIKTVAECTGVGAASQPGPPADGQPRAAAPQTGVTAGTPLVGAGVSLDSAAILELLVGLEHEFRIELNPEELLRKKALRTVGELADFIHSKLGGSH